MLLLSASGHNCSCGLLINETEHLCLCLYMSHTAQKTNIPSEWISSLPKAGKHYPLHLIGRQLEHREVWCDMRGVRKGRTYGAKTQDIWVHAQHLVLWPSWFSFSLIPPLFILPLLIFLFYCLATGCSLFSPALFLMSPESCDYSISWILPCEESLTRMLIILHPKGSPPLTPTAR